MKLIFDQNFSLSQMDQLIAKIKPYLKSQSLLLLDGEIGSGKTTLVSELMKSFGYLLASSPTYALRQSYGTVEHVDLYRLETLDEIEGSGFWDLFSETDKMVFVEWSSRIPMNQWPLNWKKYLLKIEVKNKLRNYKFYEA